MQINPTACHSLIGLLADLLRGHGAAPTGLRSKAGQVPFGHNEQPRLAGADRRILRRELPTVFFHIGLGSRPLRQARRQLHAALAIVALVVWLDRRSIRDKGLRRPTGVNVLLLLSHRDD
jgi:hypothetical protein